MSIYYTPSTRAQLYLPSVDVLVRKAVSAEYIDTENGARANKNKPVAIETMTSTVAKITVRASSLRRFAHLAVHSFHVIASQLDAGAACRHVTANPRFARTEDQ